MKDLQTVLDALEYHVAQTRSIQSTTEAIEIVRKMMQAEPVQEACCGGRDYCGRFPFCGCGGDDGLPERDNSKPAEAQGLFRKFIVQRVDGSDKPGGKHHGCEYFVLDVDHDPHAKAALQAYAAACSESHPQLSAELIARHGAPQAVPAWLPIESAPKDGTPYVAGYGRQLGFPVKVVFFNTVHKFWSRYGEADLGLPSNATHWMPIPAAPKGAL